MKSLKMKPLFLGLLTIGVTYLLGRIALGVISGLVPFLKQFLIGTNLKLGFSVDAHVVELISYITGGYIAAANIPYMALRYSVIVGCIVLGLNLVCALLYQLHLLPEVPPMYQVPVGVSIATFILIVPCCAFGGYLFSKLHVERLTHEKGRA